MRLDSLKNKVYKRIELDKHKDDYTDVGNFIKETRKELNLTQDEISEGICSISYLSKIENNQIVPNQFYIREIMEKLKVDQTVYQNSLKDKEYLERVIKAFYFMDDKEMIVVYEEIKGIDHNVLINLCKLGYTVYFNESDDNQFVMMLEHLIANMNDYEVKAYLYFSAIYFITMRKYKVALELVLLNEELNKPSDFLDALFCELSYNIKQRLMIVNCATDDYKHAMASFNKHHNIKRTILLVINKSHYLLRENPKRALKLVNTLKPNLIFGHTMEFYYFTFAKIMYQLKRNNDAILALKHITQESSFYLRKMVLLLRICIEEDDVESINDIKQVIEGYKPTKHEMNSKVFYHYLVQENRQAQKEYLRDIAIPFSIQIQDYEKLHVYTNDVMDICIETSRYKEAMQYYKKYQKEVNKVRQILY